MVTKAERDAWTVIYRLYEQYAGALRGIDGEAASEIFLQALEKLKQPMHDSTDEGRLILLAGYDLLDAVWKASQK